MTETQHMHATNARWHGVARWLLPLAAVAGMLIGSQGCAVVPPESVRLIRASIAVNAGHMADEALPIEARLIAQDNFDDLEVLLYQLAGDPVDPSTAARLSGDE